MGARRHLRSEGGFSLIELLVVLLILSALIGIAVPLFLGQSESAKDAEAQSLARRLQAETESCFVETQSWTACDSAGELDKLQLQWGTDPREIQVLVRPFGRDVVAFAATSPTGTQFAILRGIDDKAVSRVCLAPSRSYPTGGCKRGGTFAGNGFGTW